MKTNYSTGSTLGYIDIDTGELFTVAEVEQMCNREGLVPLSRKYDSSTFTIIGVSLVDGEHFVEEVQALTPNEAWLKGVDQYLNQCKTENEPHEVPDWDEWECICVIRGYPSFALLDTSDERVKLFP